MHFSSDVIYNCWIQCSINIIYVKVVDVWISSSFSVIFCIPVISVDETMVLKSLAWWNYILLPLTQINFILSEVKEAQCILKLCYQIHMYLLLLCILDEMTYISSGNVSSSGSTLFLKFTCLKHFSLSCLSDTFSIYLLQPNYVLIFKIRASFVNICGISST